jgi:hypothetical protein
MTIHQFRTDFFASRRKTGLSARPIYWGIYNIFGYISKTIPD